MCPFAASLSKFKASSDRPNVAQADALDAEMLAAYAVEGATMLACAMTMTKPTLTFLLAVAWQPMTMDGR
jgi:hypothetical protein